MSIQLDVMEKCQNCPDFKPCADHNTMYVEGKTIHEYTVTCELRPLCQELSDYIWSVLTKKLEEMGRDDKMRIIKEGSTTKQFTCSNCGCIFECDASEYRRETGCTNINVTYYTAVCPTCGMKLSFLER